MWATQSEASSSSSGPAPSCRPTGELGLSLHRTTGHLVARLSGRGLGDESLRSWVDNILRPEVAAFQSSGSTIQQGEVDLSHNNLGNGGLEVLLDAWLQMGLSCPLGLRLHHNRLGAESLGVLARFVGRYSGELRELHLTDNPLGDRAGVLALLRSLVGLPQYPVWIRRQRRHAPVYLRLGRCSIPEPQLLSEEAQQAEVRLCFMGEARCSRTTCSSARMSGRLGCPVAHLYGWLDQAPASEETPAECLDDANYEGFKDSMLPFQQEDINEPTPEKQQSRDHHDCSQHEPLSLDKRAQHFSHGKFMAQDHGPEAPTPTPMPPWTPRLFLCGACSLSKPVDMFGRHQFRKVALLDSELIDGTETSETQTAMHLVRRCNACVTQPCSACRVELPVTSFAKGQMSRPSSSRRCRPCAAFTVICVGCNLPKLPSQFSPAEVNKRRAVPKVCHACESTNPYFERRFVIVLCLTQRAGRCRPALPQEATRSIVRFADPGDEFTAITRDGFVCRLCKRSYCWSVCGPHEAERHIRTPEHRERLERLATGSLVRLLDLPNEAKERLQRGLGIRGAVCSAQQVHEASTLVHIDTANLQGVGCDALRAAGLQGGAIWVSPHVLRAAEALQLGTATPPRAALSEVKSAQRHWKLYGHLGAVGDLDADEVAILASAMGSSVDWVVPRTTKPSRKFETIDSVF